MRAHDLSKKADDDVDDAEHRRLNNEHLAAVAGGENLFMPRDRWARIRAGESPLRVIREFRGLTQAQPGEAAAIDQGQISTIENGNRRGAVGTLKALAKALEAPLDVLVEGI